MKCIVFFFIAIIGIAISTDTVMKTNVKVSTEVQNKVKTESKNQVKTNNNNQMQLKAKLLTKNNSEKSKSIMEFMNEINSNKKPNKKKGKKNKKIKIKKITIKRKTFKDPVKVIFSGWLKVSTPNFKNNARFPILTVPNSKRIHILSTKHFFRINTDFNSSNKSNSMPPSKFDFYFRLSGKNLYYASNQESINVLGTIVVNHIIDADPQDDLSKNANCFKVRDKTKTDWILCAPDMNLRDKWVCKIKDILGLPTDDCKATKLDDVKGIVYKTVIKPVIYIPLPSKPCNENWNYALKGEDWNCECSEGKTQSPINLPPFKKAIDSPVKPLFQYEDINTDEDNDDSDNPKQKLKLEYSDWSLRMKYNSFGRIVTLDGAVFAANEIIFHTPSEHTIDGKRYDMEMQVIHQGQTQGDIARQVVLSFLFEKKAGVQNKFIDDLDFFDLPNPLNKVKELNKSVNINKIFYDVTDKEYPMFKPFSFFTYQGSLSTPPCTENTIVYVASKPIHIGTTALQMFQEVSRIPDQIGANGSVKISHFNPQNSRKPQPLNGRAVFFFDHVKHCGIDPSNKKVKEVGHFEKVIKKKTDYFFVEGLNPSGLPGAFVVSDKEALGKK